jgi:hypothetical protein
VAANEILTDDVIVKEALMIVENTLSITKRINRRYESKFAKDGQKIGDSLNIRLPVRWTGREGEQMQPEGIQERSVLMKIDKMIGQDLEFSNVDLTLKMDMFKERYLDTACASIANRIDAWICESYADVPNASGTPGTVPTALDPYFDASVVLSNYGVPAGKRAMIISPRMEASIVNALKGLFQAAQSIASQYQTGGMGRVIGFDWDTDQNIKAHTVGALGGTPLVNGAGQSGSTIVTNGWTAAAATRLKRGDVITFASTDGVNPQAPRDDTGELRMFAVTADTASDGSGNMTIPIFPAMTLPGSPYQNVVGSPANAAAVKVFGDPSAYANKVTKQGLAFHKEWMTAAFVDLELPKGMEMAARAKSNKLNIAIRLIKGFDIRSNQHLCRLDVLAGKKQTYEDFACRVAA